MAEAPCEQEQSYHDPAPFTVEAQGQTLTFYPDGRDRLEALIALIESARESLKLCFYIFAEDAASTKVRDALTQAARRGVAVSLLIDSFGASADEKFFDEFVAAGGKYSCFSATWSQRYLIRNHQKMAIADGQEAMFGGFNIEDGYFETPCEDGWHDLGIVIEGDGVDRLCDWFDQLERWTESDRHQWRAIRKLLREWDPGDGPVQWLIGGPTKGLSSWARCVGEDLIEGARLDMIMAYFSPPRRLLQRIGNIARKGETRLIMAAKSDNGATIGASRSLYHDLLKRGAKIFEFEPCKLHMKLIVLDDAVYLGSANFDMRSLYVNLELMLRIEDRGLADRMRQFVDAHIPASTEITPALHRQRSGLWTRIKWNLSWFLVAVVDYTVSRKLNLGL